MAQQHRTRGLIGTWPQPGRAGAAGIAAPWLAPLPGLAGPLADRIRGWVAVEVAPGLLMPWLPVAFGLGAALYFTAEREPVWWVAALVAAAASLVAYALRARPVAFPVALGVAAVAAGLAAGAVKARLYDHAVLQSPAYGVNVTGFVETHEERERSDRIVVRVTSIEGERLTARPERIRVTVRKGQGPPVGAHVAFKARLTPPASPFRPGGYDLARELYFRGIGATGLALGAIRIETPPIEPDWRLKLAIGIETIRDSIDERIRAAVKGDSGSIASALITGKEDSISGAVFDAMFISGVGHVLSISGYHMALVAGVVIFFVRAGLALVPGLALRYPIKKWAAAVALLAAAFYLALSGAEVATQRSFIMIAVVLIGVIADRPVLTMRTITVAALAVMLLIPEAVVHPSFQMSFAATLALIAAYERGLPWSTRSADTSFGARIALWGLREAALLIFASLIAGLATTPYSAYHFHRLAPYGVIANLLAMPVISAVSMPAGLLALLAMPFGFDAPLWRVMGIGIDWMTVVSLWVAGLPGAVGRIQAFGVGALLFATAGLIVICLMRSPLRFLGIALVGLACFLALSAPRPDVLVSAAGDVVAVRGVDGRLSAIKFGSDTLSVREWLAADADARLATERAVAAGFACDPDGCVARLGDGRAVAVSRTPAALADDCARAVLVVTVRIAPPDCAAMVLDRRALQRGGATGLRWRGDSFDVTAARPPGFDRPWARERKPARPAPARGPAAPGDQSAAPPLAPDSDGEQ